ncbi:BTAD domain-containing putative transcriptional regulator [Phytohabitans flavus]|uniref:AfsR/SARP family transcriptional regulator n=1 Tax=Phytohabitans flavus TaxID=1076124 RepID=UPI003638ADF6
MLGPVTVVIGDSRHRIPRAQTRGLLALMLLNLGRRISREGVIEAMWGGAAPSTARSQVHNAITVIRAHLADFGAPEVLDSAPSGYELLVEPEQVDAARFDDGVRLARDAAARGNNREAVRLLRGALGLWTGEPLSDATGAFVDAARARLVERRLTAVEDLADLELDLGRAEVVAAEIAPLVDAHPMRERLRVRQMTALYRTGRQVEALQSYRVYRNLLAEFEGLDPGREIAELERMILRDDPVPADTPATSAPALLPPDIPDFTGRDGAVGELHHLLTEGRPSSALAVVGVAGMGGVGKTTLAVHVAHLAASGYPDGQLYANLRGTEAVALDPGDVLARFLRALGVDARAIPNDPVERAELYRTRLAARRVLVVLDNAASEEQVRPLLPGAASCAVLVTSRARLTGVEGARWIDLDVFAGAEAVRLLGRVAGDGRVAAEPAEADEIVRLCGWLPLAVRVAGARLTARPTWLLAHLSRMLRDERRRLDRLATGDLEVRASLALSYEGLKGRRSGSSGGSAGSTPRTSRPGWPARYWRSRRTPAVSWSPLWTPSWSGCPVWTPPARSATASTTWSGCTPGSAPTSRTRRANASRCSAAASAAGWRSRSGWPPGCPAPATRRSAARRLARWWSGRRTTWSRWTGSTPNGPRCSRWYARRARSTWTSSPSTWPAAWRSTSTSAACTATGAPPTASCWPPATAPATCSARR